MKNIGQERPYGQDGMMDLTQEGVDPGTYLSINTISEIVRVKVTSK